MVWKERESGKSHFKLFKMGLKIYPLYLWAVWRGIWVSGMPFLSVIVPVYNEEKP